MGHSNAFQIQNLHNSITSLCKSILPIGLKKRYLVSAEDKLSKLQSNNLKWQQETFNQMLKLMGLHQDEILLEAEVIAFRTYLLHTLLSSPPQQQDHPLILRDKLLFLQELLNAKCISEREYQSSKRPLLQRLVAEGGNIEDTQQNSEEEWSVIDLKDDQCLMNKENSNTKKKSKKAWKQIKGATSVFSFGSSHKHEKNSMEKSIFHSPSLLNSSEKCKRKPFRILFQKRDKKEGNTDDEIAPLSLNDKSDSEAYLASSQLGEGSVSEFFIDEKVSRDKIKKEPTIMQAEQSSTNTNLKISSLFDRYGGVAMLNEVTKEYKDLIDTEEKLELTMEWTTFEDDENFHPNLFVHERHNSLHSSNINPFSHG